MTKHVKIIKPVDLGEDGPQVGEVWQINLRHDYGFRRDHESITKKPHVNVSRTADYPFFTIPEEATEPVTE